ncbi:MAG: MvaI/BcnI family restriction endonuclease [Halobacteriota archaeon]
MDEKWTKEYLIERLNKVKDMGYVPSRRSVSNVGSVGNTLEDLLGLKENNIPIANAGRWELKAQTRLQTKGKAAGSYTTLFHFEPEPREVGVVTNILLPKYGWPLNENEVSFRSSTFGHRYTDRGFTIDVDRKNQRINFSFDSKKVAASHQEWLDGVEEKAGLEQISPQPHWTFDQVRPKVLQKLANVAYVLADLKREVGQTCYSYNKAWLMQDIDFDKFIDGIETGRVLIDFDARTGYQRNPHNHGTKFRINSAVNTFQTFYDNVKRIF